MVIKVTNRRDVSTIHPLDSLGILQVMMLVITMVVATVVEPDFFAVCYIAKGTCMSLAKYAG